MPDLQLKLGAQSVFALHPTVLSGDEIQQVLRGERIIRKVVDEPMRDNRRSSVPTSTPKPDLPGNLGGAVPA